MRKISWVVFGLLLIFSGCQTLPAVEDKSKQDVGYFNQMDLFTSGELGYHTFRIPSLISTSKGTLLAFCEGRKHGSSDTGNIDVLMKRSADFGATWSEAVVIWDDGENVAGNPTIVENEENGDLFLALTWNDGNDSEKEIIEKTGKSTRKVYICKSIDDGLSWTTPKDITRTTKNPFWGWYATGPGNGIQIKYGNYAGRLIIPCDHSYLNISGFSTEESFQYGSHVIFSDDGGNNWELGGSIRPGVNESQVFEAGDGTGNLVINMRSMKKKNRRELARSTDGGRSWSNPEPDPELLEPECQASIIRYGWPQANEENLVIFSNPASKVREKLTVKVSYDDGNNWAYEREIYKGPAAYSSLTKLKDGKIGCFYEGGQSSAYEKLVFATFDMEWILNGTNLQEQKEQPLANL